MTTRDAFLGGRLSILQPRHGFRAGLDSVMLAAAVDAEAGERVLELGSGVGVAALCLAARVEGIALTGVEAQGVLVGLAAENAAGNGLSDRVLFREGRVEAMPADLPRDHFDHVMMNPPFFVEGPHDAPPDEGRRIAHIADPDALARWTKTARTHLSAKGRLTAIVPTERVPALLHALGTGFGAVTLFPLWPRAGEPAKRVIVTARKSSRTGFALAAGLVLHGAERGYTPVADAILRHGAPLPVRAP